MANASPIQPHMDVIGSDGQHVGTVDGVEGNNIKLTRKDSEDGQHLYVPMSAVETADGGEVRLNVTADEAKSNLSGSGDAEISVGNGM
jgi:hypothetical protein